MGIVLHTEDTYIREHLLEGTVGLEVESMRIDHRGNISRKPHPFPDDPEVDRDFGEAQLEMVMMPKKSVREAIDELKKVSAKVHTVLAKNNELLWPFSNPPVILNRDDLQPANFTEEKRDKTAYRRYLAKKYGIYKMSFSGIHFNYSFSPELIRRNFELDDAGKLPCTIPHRASAGKPSGGNEDPDNATKPPCTDSLQALDGKLFIGITRLDTAETLMQYNDRFYLELAQKILEYGWMITALLGASPVVDSSFYMQGTSGKSVFTGKSSLRCSESGYWNHFVPYIDYSSVQSYADSIRKYVDAGLLAQETELYYPVRIKNPGVYSLSGLTEKGINHIELRMVDLNPFSDCGLDYRDAYFIELFLIWLAASDGRNLNMAQQVQAIQNYKDASAYDWNTAGITFSNGRVMPLKSALIHCLKDMQTFFGEEQTEIVHILQYQMKKVEKEGNRYACRIVRCFGDRYIEQGLLRAWEIQEIMHV